MTLSTRLATMAGRILACRLACRILPGRILAARTLAARTLAGWILLACGLPVLESDAGEELQVASVVITALKQVEVPARQRGALTEVNVEEGDWVREGGLLARIDDQDARLAKTRAAIAYHAAEEQANDTLDIQLAKKILALARSDLARGERARARVRDAVTDQEMEYRRLKVEQAAIEVEQAELQKKLAASRVQTSETDLKAAERLIDLHRIVAPLAGMVTAVNRRNGEWVEPGQTTIKITHIDRLRAEGFIDAKHLARVKAGQSVLVIVKDAEAKREFPGVLKFVSPEINPLDRRVRISAIIENRELKLRPGERGVMKIELKETP